MLQEQNRVKKLFLKSLTNLVVCGKIISSFGIDGRVKIKKLNFIDEYYKKIKKFYLDSFGFFYLNVKNLEVYREDYIVKFDGIDSINEAENIKGFYLFGKLIFSKIQKDAIIYNLSDYKIKTDILEKEVELIGWEESKGKKYFNILINGKEILLPIEDYFIKIDNRERKIYLKNLKEVI